jgi:hypothetical protein
LVNKLEQLAVSKVLATNKILTTFIVLPSRIDELNIQRHYLFL